MIRSQFVRQVLPVYWPDVSTNENHGNFIRPQNYLPYKKLFRNISSSKGEVIVDVFIHCTECKLCNGKRLWEICHLNRHFKSVGTKKTHLRPWWESNRDRLCCYLMLWRNMCFLLTCSCWESWILLWWSLYTWYISSTVSSPYDINSPMGFDTKWESRLWDQL